MDAVQKAGNGHPGTAMAMAERFLADRYNRIGHEIVDHRVFAICSDGDLMEGVSGEAASLAGQNALGKLVYFYDDNRISIDGTTAISFDGEDKGKRFEAQGWHVQHVADSEDLEALAEAAQNAIAEGDARRWSSCARTSPTPRRTRWTPPPPTARPWGKRRFGRPKWPSASTPTSTSPSRIRSTNTWTRGRGDASSRR